MNCHPDYMQHFRGVYCDTSVKLIRSQLNQASLKYLPLNLSWKIGEQTSLV